MITKSAVKTNVALKITFSSPLRVKDDCPAPNDLPKPVPFDWIRIAPIKRTAVTIWPKRSKFAIVLLYLFFT